jgi:hypothetical protein
VLFSALWNSSDIYHDALGGSAPSAWVSHGCDSAVLPVHNRREISCTDKCSGIAMRPPMGQDWRKGFYHHYEKRFFQNTFFLIIYRGGYQDIIRAPVRPSCLFLLSKASGEEEFNGEKHVSAGS